MTIITCKNGCGSRLTRASSDTHNCVKVLLGEIDTLNKQHQTQHSEQVLAMETMKTFFSAQMAELRALLEGQHETGGQGRHRHHQRAPRRESSHAFHATRRARQDEGNFAVDSSNRNVDLTNGSSHDNSSSGSDEEGGGRTEDYHSSTDEADKEDNETNVATLINVSRNGNISNKRRRH